MAKPKLADFKRFLAEMTQEELRAEMLKLFSKLDQVQAFYAQELMNYMVTKKFNQRPNLKAFVVLVHGIELHQREMIL